MARVELLAEARLDLGADVLGLADEARAKLRASEAFELAPVMVGMQANEASVVEVLWRERRE